MATYNQGDVLRVRAFFTDPFSTPTPNDPIDPTAVYLRVRRPDDTVVQYAYPTDPIQKPAVGEYYFDLDLDQGGEYCYRWYSTGVGQAAEDIKVTAIPDCTVVT